MSFVGLPSYDSGGFCSVGYDVCPHTELLSIQNIGNIDCTKAPPNTFYISGQVIRNSSDNNSLPDGYCGCGSQNNYQNGPSYPVSNCGTYNHIITQQSVTNYNNTSAWTYLRYPFDPWMFHVYKQMGNGGVLCCAS